MVWPPYTPVRSSGSHSLPPSSPLSPLTSSPSGPYFPTTPPGDTFLAFDSDDLQLIANASSPVKGSREERVNKRRVKGQRKRAETLAGKLAMEEEILLEAVRLEDECSNQRVAEKHSYFDEVLTGLRHQGYSFGELLHYVSDPAFKQGQTRWEIFRDHALFSRIMDLWANKSSSTSRDRVHFWAVEFVASLVKKEARCITDSGMLQAHRQPMNASFVLSFSLSSLQTRLQKEIPTITTILSSIATSARQAKKMSPQRLAKKLMVVASSTLALLGEYSYNNNWVKKIISLYLYSAGSQRQPLSVLSHLGLGESYETIIAKKRVRQSKKARDPDQPQETAFKMLRAGSLRELSNSQVDMACVVASTGLFGTTYDNINMVFKAVEQVVGRTDDIILTKSDGQKLSQHLLHCILRIIVTHGGDGFKGFNDDLHKSLPATPHKIDLHKTNLHPLPAFDIDESTIVGGAEVVDAIFNVLQLKETPGWDHIARIFCGDQLTIARLRALQNIRAGHEGGYTGFGWGVWMPGLFHLKMADIHGSFLLHWGKATAGPRNPGCLSFHNTVLQRKPIIITSLPPFRTCRDLIFVSLYARILHCLLLVSNCSSLSEYVAQDDFSWSLLETHAHKILIEYANSDVAADLRWQRKRTDLNKSSIKPTATEPSSPLQESQVSAGDMVFENAILYLRDALLSREFTDAVKAGDSGRVVLVLKVWAFSFRGNGRTKYAHEMLHLIHNIEHVWPKETRDIVFNNWLLNPSGKPNSWIEVDLMQEHMNFWIKNFYRAHGSAASWEWLEMIAPCIDVLRQLSRNFRQMFGSDIGTAHHPPDLSVDIPDLMASLEEHEVYCFKNGRILDDDDPPVSDAVSIGFDALLSGRSNPLKEYNTAFTNLQSRRCLTPLVSDEGQANSPHTTQPLSIPLVPEIVALTEPGPPAAELEQATPDTTGGMGTEELNRTEEFDDDDEDSQELPEYMAAFAEDELREPTLGLENAADVSFDMDAEDAGGYSANIFDILDDENEADEDLSSSASENGSDSGENLVESDGNE